nr:MAG TPA: hypothetical protein [Caudoviricetes sp.]
MPYSISDFRKLEIAFDTLIDLPTFNLLWSKAEK